MAPVVRSRASVLGATVWMTVLVSWAPPALAAPALMDPGLTATPVVTSLSQPIALSFIGPDDFFVIERTGIVKRVTSGTAVPVLDLPANSAHERGALGLAVHPQFATNRLVYLFWTESTIGADTTDPLATSVLGHRVDRFVWNGTVLVFDRTIARFRAFQHDAGQAPNGNHNSGVLRFGPDGKLYVMVGDVGRRGWMQNLPSGPFIDGGPDDQFGGPVADDAHLTGVIVRLDDDGGAPADNPFATVGAALGGEVGANLQKIYSYGHRNGFGLAFDPVGGFLWQTENGDDAFDEINRIVPGANHGWIQVMGPLSRIAQYKEIETTMFGRALQQLRWPPTRIAYTASQAMSRLFMLPGGHYADPEFSWKFNVAPAALGFVSGPGLGAAHDGTLWVGASTSNLHSGYLFRFELSLDRLHVAPADPRLADRVADNAAKYDATESESLLIGTDFGTVTDIQTGPDGALYVVSLSHGTVYRISRRP